MLGEGLCDSFGDLSFELADKLDWCLAGASNLAKDMLRVDLSGFASLTKIDIAADGALVANSLDRLDLAAIAGDSSMLDALLLFICSPCRWIQYL